MLANVEGQSLYESEINISYSSSLNPSSKSNNFWLFLRFLFLLLYYLETSDFTSSKLQGQNNSGVTTWFLFLWDFIRFVVQYLAYKEGLGINIKAWEITQMLLPYCSVILHSKTSLPSEFLLTLRGAANNCDLQSHQNYGNAYFNQNCNYEEICCRKIYWLNKD